MSYRLSYATVRESKGQAIHAVRVHGEILELDEIDDLAMRLRERLASRGELNADVVVVQGEGKTSLRLLGCLIRRDGSAPRCSTRQYAGVRSTSTELASSPGEPPHHRLNRRTPSPPVRQSLSIAKPSRPQRGLVTDRRS